MNVELGDGVACAGAGVCHVHADFDLPAVYAGLFCAQLQIVVGEFCVAQAVAERVERRAGDVPVARFEVGGGFGSLRQIVVVVERQLA